MNGYYPYHEMNTYLGLIAIVLAIVGAGGKPAHDRWVAFWVLLVGLAVVLMLGQIHVSVRLCATRFPFWGALASRCAFISGSRWGWPRWRPPGSSAWSETRACRSGAD